MRLLRPAETLCRGSGLKLGQTRSVCPAGRQGQRRSERRTLDLKVSSPVLCSLQDSSQRQRHRVLHRRQPDGRGRVGVHLDEIPLVQRRFREEDPAGGADLLRQHLPAQQVGAASVLLPSNVSHETKNSTFMQKTKKTRSYKDLHES